MGQGFQFFHIEAYGRVGSKCGKPTMTKGSKASGGGKGKWSLSQILDEAERIPDAVPHVEAPQQPVHLFGMKPREFLAYAESQAEGAVDATLKAKLRKDAVIAVAGVASFPIEAKDIRHDSEALTDYLAWEETLLKFLKLEYGDMLKSVLRHTDETYWHVHFYVAEEKDKDNRLGVLKIHPGRRAKEEVRQKGGGTREQNNALKKAMEKLQDRYWQHVSRLCNHERAGPHIRRMARWEWKETKLKSIHLRQLREEVLKTKKKLDRELSILEAKTKATVEAEIQEERKRSKSQIQALEMQLARITAAYESEHCQRQLVERKLREAEQQLDFIRKMDALKAEKDREQEEQATSL